MRILVVEDDAPLREAIVAVLKEDDYAVDEAGDGDEGLYHARQGVYDLVILDVMLPGIGGLDIVRRLRADGDRTPIMLLTARDSVADKVAGLDSGADDYLVKPFAVPELLARIKALLRRGGPVSADGELYYGGIAASPKAKDAFVDGAALHLTAKEYELLEFLVINREQILTREQIFDRVWGVESETTHGIVDLYIHYLRKKLAPFGRDAVIQTVRGAGFMLKLK
ncbi:response regulator transcription factor [Anaeroselena agilis]|uniref:Response regulator transcription factor n=1 Tax=Anaeroselena agilis TaxID=3063788 RepID=A0ABU3P1Q0_9FIRM|nr:response regulator transcription factor [Selenomonadales bacterium 4137-cl]